MPTLVSIPDQRSFWNEWHGKHGATGEDQVHRVSRETFLRELKGAGGDLSVLDLGCGQGHDVRRFAQAGYTVFGMDFSTEAIKRARRATPWIRWRRRQRTNLREHDITRRLPYPDHSFDGVFSHLALHYITDEVTRRVFADIERVTKPGGILVFTVKSVADSYCGKGDRIANNVYCRKGHVRHFFSDDYARELLTGWAIQTIEHLEGHYASHEPSNFILVVAVRKV